MTEMDTFGGGRLTPPVTDTQGPQLSTYDVVNPLFEAKGWIKFLGIIMIVLGVIYCLTIIGAIIGWLPIWIGILMVSSANKINEGYLNQHLFLLRDGLEKLKTMFVIIGIVTLIGLVLNVLFIVMYIVIIIAAIAGGGFNTGP